MMRWWRPVALATAFCLVVGAGAAMAQTVIVLHAPPRSPIEVFLNDKSLGSAAADASGMARVSVKAVTSETSAHVYVDLCGDRRRVLLVEPGLQPPAPEPGCNRRDIAGLFVVRPVTTFVVDVGGPSPQVWLSQGPAPSSWLREPSGGEPGRPSGPERLAPRGLVLSAGGAFVNFGNMVSNACGTAAQCGGHDYRAGFSAGIAYWLNRYIAAEATFAKPAIATANGSDTTYNFDTSLDARMVTLVGKVGAPIGPMRLYGEAGFDYHRATSSTTETINDLTLIVNDVAQTIPGGTQSWSLTTQGWGWMFGGGFEGWVTPYFAIYAEATYAKLKGGDVHGSEGTIDEGLTSIMAGVRFHVGR